MNHFSSIIIIYNPNSTGPSKKKADALASQLRQTAFKSIVRVVPTKYAGHGEQLAYNYARKSSGSLIISSSGDGGYNEIVNGAMKAEEEGTMVTTGLLPAGNANDHYNNLHKHDTVDQILKGRVQRIDLLRITTIAQDSWTRYAHSYIGVGLTPNVGKELNKVNLNAFNEKWIILKSFYRLRPVHLSVRGKTKIYDSVVLANIGRMSKILSLSDTASPTDGKFELITFKHQTKRKLLLQLFQAATKGLHTTNRRTEYAFKTIEPISIQLDGEVSDIPAGTRVEVTLMPKSLTCIV